VVVIVAWCAQPWRARRRLGPVPIPNWRLTQRLTAAMLVVAVGWPSSAAAMAAPGTAAKLESTAKAEPDAKAQRAAKAEWTAEPERAAKPEQATEPERAAKAEWTAEPERAAKPEQATEPDTETEPGSETEPDSETETEPGAKMEPDATTQAPEPPSPQVKLTAEQLAERLMDKRLEHAELRWQEGERLYQNGRYAEAAVEFERSYAAVAAAATLYSVAPSYERAGKPVEAVRALERYLALPDCPDGPPEERPIDCTQQRPLAEQALAEQRRRVGELVIALGDGVKLREVRVAGRTVPLEDFPLVLLPGTVDVEVFGLKPDERRSRPAYITPGETFTLYVAPFDAEVARRPPTVTPIEGDPVDELRLERRQRQLQTTFWVGTGLTAAAGVALAVTGGLGRYHQQRFNIEKCPSKCWEMNADGTPKRDAAGQIIYLDRPYPENHEDALARYKPVANAMLAVTIGIGVATALVGAFAFRKRDREQASARAGTGERVRARVRLGGSGLVVRW
jgi:hypothetical protein